DLALAHVPQLDGTNDWNIVLDDIVGAGQNLAVRAEGDGCVLAGVGSFQRSEELELRFGLACPDRRHDGNREEYAHGSHDRIPHQEVTAQGVYICLSPPSLVGKGAGGLGW